MGVSTQTPLLLYLYRRRRKKAEKLGGNSKKKNHYAFLVVERGGHLILAADGGPQLFFPLDSKTYRRLHLLFSSSLSVSPYTSIKGNAAHDWWFYFYVQNNSFILEGKKKRKLTSSLLSSKILGRSKCPYSIVISRLTKIQIFLCVISGGCIFDAVKLWGQTGISPYSRQECGKKDQICRNVNNLC